MAENEKWQKKPDEGGFSARRDGDSHSSERRSSRPEFRPGGNSSYGNSSDRPKRNYNDNEGGADRGNNSFDKPRRGFGGDSSNSDRPKRSFDSNGGNSFGGPRRSFGGGSGSDRPSRPYGGDSSIDRPRRSFGDNAGSDRPSRPYGGDSNSDRPRRSFGDNDGGNSYDRPKRSFGGEGVNGNSYENHNRSSSEGDRGNSYDKPRRGFGDSNDRPKRSFGDSSDRPSRSYGDSSDRPKRAYGDSNDRPSRSYGDSSDRPKRAYGDSNDRPSRSYGDSSDRPQRSFGDGPFKPRFNGPSLPKPDREDGRQRRPRIQKTGRSFDHGKPFNSHSVPNYPVFLDPDTPIRLNKFLANAGLCSRREADEFIQAGVVRVNGEVVSELGVKVKPTDTILFHDQAVSIEHKVYLLLNKPKDCVTTSDDPQERRTVLDLVKDACGERVYPVGRLDRNTTGVLLLTNDGDLASKLTHPKYEKRKIYQVTLDKDMELEDIQHILDGVTLDDCEVKADNCSLVDYDNKNVVGIEIHTGQNRVIRRIFESLGYKVFKLDRVYFAGLTKKNLPRGKWRHLSEKEVSLLKMGAFV